MSFPWDVTVTGASTLIASLGTVGLGGWLTSRRTAQQGKQDDIRHLQDLRREAYTDFLEHAGIASRNLSTDFYNRAHGIPLATDQAIDDTNQQVNRCVQRIQIVGSDVTAAAAFEAVKAYDRAASHLYPGREFDWGAADNARKAFLDLVSQFAATCRSELAGKVS